MPYLPREVVERRIQEWICQVLMVVTPDGTTVIRQKSYGLPHDILRCFEEMYPKDGGWQHLYVVQEDSPELREDIKRWAARLRPEIVVWNLKTEEAPFDESVKRILN